MEILLQAAFTLVSHLSAQGFQARAQEHIVIIDVDGRQQEIEIGTSYGARRVDAEDLRSASIERTSRALEAVRRMTGLAIDTRGTYREIKARRADIGAGFEDIVMRSKILGRCPNPSNSEILKWRPVVRKAAKQVFYKFRTPLLAFGYEAEDMESLGLVHLVTALHRYQTGDVARDKAVIGRYVKQRLTEVVRKTQRKGNRCSASHKVRDFMELRT